MIEELRSKKIDRSGNRMRVIAGRWPCDERHEEDYASQLCPWLSLCSNAHFESLARVRPNREGMRHSSLGCNGESCTVAITGSPDTYSRI